MTNEEKIYQVLEDFYCFGERLDHEPISSVIEAAEKAKLFCQTAGENLVLKSKSDDNFI